MQKLIVSVSLFLATAALVPGCQSRSMCCKKRTCRMNQKMKCAPCCMPRIDNAVCVLRSFDDSGVSGVLHLQRAGDKVHVTGQVKGLTPGKHGFHVHEYGDMTDMQTGKSTGGHFNPDNMPHGRPQDAKRHVGDLGNIVANDKGVANIDIMDDVIALNGPHSIIGRAFIVHSGEDHFTQPTGDADGRVAGGVIGIAPAP